MTVIEDTPTTATQHATFRAPNVLRILTGLHAGASRTLAEREMILVGSGEDCDIVLADHGVARHHALINLLGDVSSLRALDAPLRVDGQPLQPGDPVELKPLQRIQIGDTAIAIGEEADTGWSQLQAHGLGAAATRVKNAGMRRLPMIAALAALSLASLAIFAAVMPARDKQVDATAELKAAAQQFHVAHARVVDDAGVPTLVGTVNDQATSERIRRRLLDRGVTPSLQLRTGEQIAADVSEVLRAQGVSATTRYLGDGRVEANGRFEDMQALRDAAQSRAMRDVKGVTEVVTNNSVPQGATAQAGGKPAPGQPAVAAAALRIVAIARGRDAHLTALGGEEFQVGSDIPGLGKLIAIGETAQVIDGAGMLHKVTVQPVTAEELAEAADRQATLDAQSQAGTAPATASTSTATGTSSAPPSKQVAQLAAPAKKS